MPGGIIYIIISFLIVGALSYWGVAYTRKNMHDDIKQKYKLARLLIVIGLVISISFVFLAKKVSYNADIVIAWLMLGTGCFFAAGLSFLTGYIQEK